MSERKFTTIEVDRDDARITVDVCVEFFQADRAEGARAETFFESAIIADYDQDPDYEGDPVKREVGTTIELTPSEIEKAETQIREENK